MADRDRTVFELPPFDTGQYNGFEFEMSDGAATLTIRVEGQSAIVLRFRRVRWHQFTALYNCTPAMSRAYFRLVEVDPTVAVEPFVRSDGASVKAYSELHHFRIFLDESGCHELFAEAVDAP